MESHGTGGSVQITRSTYELIKDDFVLESRGTVNVKGKGDLEVWFVVDRNSAEIDTPIDPSRPARYSETSQSNQPGEK